MLRAGPLSDQRIVALLNRRFVPFVFDLSDRGFAGDPKAREFVLKAKPAYGGNSVTTPRVLFMTPEGEIVAEEDNFATEVQFLQTLRKVVSANPDFMQPTEAERALTSPVQRARVALDLLDYPQARKELTSADSDFAHFLRGQLERREANWEDMKAAFAQVRDPLFHDDVRMEKAYEFLVYGQYGKLQRALTDFPKVSNRYTEARYYEGIALYHLGKVEEAQEVWKSTIKSSKQDGWIYRADWAYCDTKQKGNRAALSSAGPRTSCLNRIGYMGRKNPDLTPRSR